jgi:phage terminase large subunit-like protein
MQADILAGDVDARGCPVTAWSVSNVVDQRDGKDNMMFVKKKSRGRIDPVIAPTIGMALAIREPAKVDTSVMPEWASWRSAVSDGQTHQLRNISR